MNIYVGNLSFNASEDDIRQAFAAFGEVSTVSIIKDQFSGRPRGFAFVEMQNSNEANSAIAALNGKDMQGRNLIVNEAQPRADRPRGGSGSGGGSGGGGGRDGMQRRGPGSGRRSGSGGGSGRGGRSGSGGHRREW